MSRLLTRTDAAELLSVHPRTIWNLTRKGILPVIRVGGQLRYSPDSLREWMASREQKAQTVA